LGRGEGERKLSIFFSGLRPRAGAASWFLNALQAWFHDAAEPMRSRWDVHGNRAVETVDDLRRAATPHWAALALMGSSSCAYDWIAGDDAIEWLGNPVELFDLDAAKIPASRAEVMALMRPGARLPLDKMVYADPSGRETFSGRYALRTKTGGYVAIEDRGIVLRGADGRIERVVGTLSTTQFGPDAQGERTGHLDRGQMRDAIVAAIDWAVSAGLDAALLMVSIDALGTINDSYGLDVADEVIAATTRRLAAALGPDGGALGRVGGNKVAILLLDCEREQIRTQAARLREAVQESMIPTGGGPIAATVSMGALPLPSGATTSEIALMRAEDALSLAKRSGRSSLAIYDASPEREAARKHKANTGAQIIAALKADRFRLAYQPIVCARTGRTESYEALIRMLREDGSLVPAGDFIPAAEELGLVRDLDRRVLELASVALRRAPALKLGVNVSGMNVGDEMWMHTFNAYLAGDRSLTSRLTIEVTETAALHDIDDGIRFVQQLRAAGCRVAIDDFGAGYTSFRNLQTLDLNCVKIDGSFVKGIAARPDNQAFVRTLVSLAKTFNLEVVAEWVGTKEEATLLRALGADKFQGWLYGAADMTPPWDRRAS
jgi:diguanylate cyclase (GGDEF)-like protein